MKSKLKNSAALTEANLEFYLNNTDAVIREAYGITEKELQGILKDPRVIAEYERLGEENHTAKIVAAIEKLRKRG